MTITKYLQAIENQTAINYHHKSRLTHTWRLSPAEPTYRSDTPPEAGDSFSSLFLNCSKFINKTP